MLFGKTQAQCSFEIQTKVKNSICIADGEICVTLLGNDIANSPIKIELTTTNTNTNVSPGNGNNHCFLGLRPGTYTIRATATCKESGDSITITKDATITSNYKEPTFIVGAISPSICGAPGSVQLTALDGIPPYHVNTTLLPSSPRGADVTLSSPNYPFNLPAGKYIIEIFDNCVYKRTDTISIPRKELSVDVFYVARDSCDSPNAPTGAIRLEISGTKAPYRIVEYDKTTNDLVIPINKLAAGDYNFIVGDACGDSLPIPVTIRCVASSPPPPCSEFPGYFGSPTCEIGRIICNNNDYYNWRFSIRIDTCFSQQYQWRLLFEGNTLEEGSATSGGNVFLQQNLEYGVNYKLYVTVDGKPFPFTIFQPELNLKKSDYASAWWSCNEYLYNIVVERGCQCYGVFINDTLKCTGEPCTLPLEYNREYTITLKNGKGEIVDSITVKKDRKLEVKEFTIDTHNTCDGVLVTPQATVWENGAMGDEKKISFKFIEGSNPFLDSSRCVIELYYDGPNCNKLGTLDTLIRWERLGLGGKSTYACHGGNQGLIILEATGGVKPYWYQLEEGGKKLDSGIFPSVKLGKTYKVILSDSCNYSFPVEITIDSLPKITIEPVAELCEGDTIKLRSTRTLLGARYEWKHEGNPILKGNEPELTIPLAKVSDGGRYSLYVKLGDCEIFDATTVTVRPSKLLQDTIFICQEIKEYELPPVPTGYSPPWYSAEGTHPSGWIDVSKKQEYAVYITPNGDNSECVNKIIIKKRPASGKIVDTTICKNSSFHFNGKDYNKTGNYSDTLPNSFGCDSIVILKLRVDAPRDTTINDAIFVGEDYYKNNFKIPTQTAATTIFDTLDTHKCDSTVFLILEVLCYSDITKIFDTIIVGKPYDKNGFSISIQNFVTTLTRTLNLNNKYSCDSIVNLILEVIELPVPNVFTPNGDGINDIYLENIDLLKHITILNRWGQIVYEGTTGWDGRTNGVEVAAGTYFYIITTHSGTTYKGSLTLLRQ